MLALSACFALSMFSNHALAQSAAEIAFWNAVAQSQSVDQIQLYLDKYPQGTFAELAKMKVKELDADRESVEAARRCDELAAHSADRTHSLAGVPWNKLQDHAEEAVKACRLAAENGDPRLLFQLGRALLANGKNAEAIRIYGVASKRGHMLASYFRAKYMSRGSYGVTKDVANSLKLYEQNAARGHPESALDAGNMYWEGDVGLPKNHFKAKSLLEQAEAGGVELAYPKLGAIWYDGEGVEHDKDKAKSYFLKTLKSSFGEWHQFARDYLRNIYKSEIRSAMANSTNKTKHAKIRHDLLLDFDSPYYALLKLEEDARDNAEVGTHIVYIQEIYNLVDDILSRFDPASLSSEHHKARVVLDTLYVKMISALKDRSKAFPDQFPYEDESFVEDLVVKWKNNNIELAEQYTKERPFSDWQFGSWTKDDFIGGGAERSARCAERDIGFVGDDHVVVLKFKNICPFSLLARGVLWVTDEKSGATKKRKFSVTIASGKRESIKLRHGLSGSLDAQSRSEFCLEDLGFSKEEDEGKYSCGKGFSFTSHDLDKVRIEKAILYWVGW